MNTRLSIFVLFPLLLVGCKSLPPMDSSTLIERMTNAYASCRTFQDSGVITQTDIEFGETNVSQVTYSIQFVRNHAFRLELHSKREHDAGSYSLVYHKAAGRWAVFDTLSSEFGGRLIRSNVSQESVIGQGIALSYGIFPDIARLLHLDTNSLSGFHLFDRARVTRERLHRVSVYRLRLEWDFFSDRDVDEYWIDPETFLILKQRYHAVKPRGDRVDIEAREMFRAPKRDSLPPDTVIEFSPPKSRANNGAAANGLQAVRSSVAEIRERTVRSTAVAERYRECFTSIWHEHL